MLSSRRCRLRSRGGIVQRRGRQKKASGSWHQELLALRCDEETAERVRVILYQVPAWLQESDIWHWLVAQSNWRYAAEGKGTKGAWVTTGRPRLGGVCSISLCNEIPPSGFATVNTKKWGCREAGKACGGRKERSSEDAVARVSRVKTRGKDGSNGNGGDGRGLRGFIMVSIEGNKQVAKSNIDNEMWGLSKIGMSKTGKGKKSFSTQILKRQNTDHKRSKTLDVKRRCPNMHGLVRDG